MAFNLIINAAFQTGRNHRMITHRCFETLINEPVLSSNAVGKPTSLVRRVVHTLAGLRFLGAHVSIEQNKATDGEVSANSCERMCHESSR